MAKVELRREDASAGERARLWLAAARGLAGMLRMLHPIMPFVTEQAWGYLHALDPQCHRERAAAGRPPLGTPAAMRTRPSSPRWPTWWSWCATCATSARSPGRRPAEWLPLMSRPADARAEGSCRRAGRTSSRWREDDRSRSVSARDATRSAGTRRCQPAGCRMVGAETSRPRTPLRRRAGTGRAPARGIERLRQLLANPGFVERAPARSSRASARGSPSWRLSSRSWRVDQGLDAAALLESRR